MFGTQVKNSSLQEKLQEAIANDNLPKHVGKQIFEAIVKGAISDRDLAEMFLNSGLAAHTIAFNRDYIEELRQSQNRTQGSYDRVLDRVLSGLESISANLETDNGRLELARLTMDLARCHAETVERMNENNNIVWFGLGSLAMFLGTMVYISERDRCS